MTSVLVLAHNPEIEALLADLVMFAGHQPVFVRDDETAVQAMRRRQVPAVLLDTALPTNILDACEHAAADTASALVFVGSSMSDGELRTFAAMRHALYFSLPNGPNLLSSILRQALARRGTREGNPLPLGRREMPA